MQSIQYRTAIKVDPTSDRTWVRLKISAAGIFREAKQLYWSNYVQACRQSLHRVAAEESLEILVWSVDLDETREFVSHQVTLRGALWGMLPLRIARALRPPTGYWAIDFLERGLQNGWPVKPILKATMEFQQLKRYDRNGMRLEEPVPEQLLARAVTESGWRKLISPSDKPWAFINTATQRIYERHYRETDESEREYDPTLSYEQIDCANQPTGDEFVIEDIPDVLRTAGCPEDVTQILIAGAQGRKLRELPEYLTSQTGTLWDARRVDAARGMLRRARHRLRAVALESSQWKPRQTDGTVYRQRLPDGALWNGVWTYDHTYKGEELQILHDIALLKWSELLRQK